MPRVVDYEVVSERMTAQGMRSLYHNSGAFGFAEGMETFARGWIGPEDPTIRQEARPVIRSVPAPYESNMARLLSRVWLAHLHGIAWVMPRSHWSYELDFGSREWLPAALEGIGIEPGMLAPRNNAAAIEFTFAESESFTHLVQILLEKLLGSDFAVAFPHQPALCTVHHHKQVWWQTTDPQFLACLDAELIASVP